MAVPCGRCPGVRRRLPVLRWLPRYRPAWLQLDLVAGLTVGLTAVPQALAYAEVAGLPLQVGGSARRHRGPGDTRCPTAAPRRGPDGRGLGLRGHPFGGSGSRRRRGLAQGWQRALEGPAGSPALLVLEACGISQRCAGAAFVPVQYGLYSSFMGCFVYCFLGTAKDVTLGPTAIMSLLVSSYAFHEPVYAILLAFLSGCIQLAMGLLHLGEMLLPCMVVFLGYHCTSCRCSPISCALRDTGVVLLMLVMALRVCKHPVLPVGASSVLTAARPMQVSFWTSFPTQSLKGLHRRLPSPLASTRSR